MMLNVNDLVAPGRSIQNVGSIGHEGERRIERILIEHGEGRRGERGGHERTERSRTSGRHRGRSM